MIIYADTILKRMLFVLIFATNVVFLIVSLPTKAFSICDDVRRFSLFGVRFVVVSQHRHLLQHTSDFQYAHCLLYFHI